jgi:cytoskeletal protein CcmA (bactofilin family)
MSDNQSPNALLLNSIIGEGTSFKGEFDLNGLLRIDGDFTGTIRTNGQIIVGLNGRAHCNIYAESVVIGGMVRGNVFTTDKVIILSTGMMLGSICTPRLIVEEGVVFNGNCKITSKQGITDKVTSGRATPGRVAVGPAAPGADQRDTALRQAAKVTGEGRSGHNDLHETISTRN